MKFHKEGYPTLIVALLFSAAVIFAVRYFLPTVIIVHYLSYALAAFLIVTVLQFFRNPSRIFTSHESAVISPADGKVVVIEEVMETEYFKDKRIQVSVFMSPINVHINRYPIAGKVSYMKYHPGLYLVAWHPKSSTENERTTVVVKHKSGTEVLFRQIAGALARRIVFYCKEGDEAKQAGEMGFIKFGSRVDILLPVGTRIDVKLGDKVTGGISILGHLTTV
jgi:phosphatidylserine decarboxylase